MNLRAFLKGEQSPSKTPVTLEKYMNISSFAAPKRNYFKPTYSSAKVPKKTLDENECPSENVKKEEAQYSARLLGTRALDDLQTGDKNGTLLTPKKLELSKRCPNTVLSKGQMERALKEFGLKWNSNEKISGSNLKHMMQDTDNIMVSLIEEIDRLNELLIEKINENEKLKVQNVSLETRLIEMSHKEANVGILRQELLRKTSNELISFDTQMNPKMTLNSEESSETSFDSNLQKKCNTCNSQTKGNFSRRPSKKQILDLRFEKTCPSLPFREDKVKSQDLYKSLESLKEVLTQKEEENAFLQNEVEVLKKNYESISQQVVQHQQVTEKLRSELKNSYSQNQELNQKLISFKSENLSPTLKNAKVTTISFSRVESPRTNITNQDTNEWQKKYEAAKNDNDRLVKIIEQNHLTIKNFKEIFSDLQKRHNVNYEQLKQEYEGRIKGLTEVRNDSRVEGQNSFSGTSHSIFISSEFLRTSRDNLDLSRSKNDYLLNSNKS